MKQLLVYLFLIVSCGSAVAQKDSIKAGYLRFPTIPPFTLLKIDSSSLTRNNLKKNRNTLIMYFSPDCDHCKHQTDSMLARIKNFKNIQILMATYQPFDQMKAFYKEYKISAYPNIILGRDTKFFFPPFYKIVNLPYMILYDTKGKLITTFEGSTSIDMLLKAFSNNRT